MELTAIIRSVEEFETHVCLCVERQTCLKRLV
jgi:hypothetical protein